MTKEEFLKKLEHELRKLKKEERNKYIEYYDEIISDTVESGASVEDAIAKQGDIKKIVEDILANASPTDIKNKDWRGITLVAASLILLLFCFAPLILGMQMHIGMSTSVGIIGGADGPTSIFIAGKIGTPWGLYIATAVVVVATIVYFVKKRRK